MPLTRHFYSTDEVQSALYYSASRRDTKETEFWCRELILSGYTSEAISTLFESWLWQRGPFCLRWLLDAQALTSDHVSQEDILRSAVTLSSYTEWDNSLWSILNSAVPDRVTYKTPPVPAANEKVQYLYRAMYQGKAKSAWWMAQQIDGLPKVLRCYANAMWVECLACMDILEHYENLLGYCSREYDVVIRCCMVLMLCLSPAKKESTFRTVKASLSVFTEGRKASRIYSIPAYALYGTARGRMSWSQENTVELNHVEKYMRGCPFWDEVIGNYKRNGAWVSEDAEEAFYEEYFPDDIPDEWTKADKERSHGKGLLKPEETMTLAKYAKIHFTKPCRLAWGTIVDMGRLTTEICHPTEVVKMMRCEGNVSLAPLRRKYIN